MRPRHYGILASFVILVLVPFVLCVFYLFVIADDQYASRVGFAVRSEEINSAQDLLGGISSSLSGTSSSDADILYEFIQSQNLVERVNADLDLVTMYTVPSFDPVFAYHPTGQIEDLAEYWKRMVQVSYDSNTGLIALRVNAFRAEDARAIAERIVAESTRLINDLSAIARQDATRYARAELELSLERLKGARETLTQFRSRTQLVDPSADIQGQMGLLNSLEAQLAEANIELNLLLETSREGDPRVSQARRRIAVITNLIEEERTKFGFGGTTRADGTDYSTLVGEFERLMVDLEYAEKSYLAAQTALDTALAEAQRQSRYLATYTNPTMAQSSRYPKRFLLSVIAGAVLLLSWALLVLVYYSLRDRR
ncbi:capsular polysaccharide transport system permease protein [Roseovarius pacificus]|uniref:Capsular polysaccharide transport system permease protein n=1 Tax=Roseovarius pacificus TaxID=337701 RepID=A0A1M7GEC6_9RHOB|nr:sugar transporter [Roseovarius pacificus]GGO59955.1 hypothetical protein GCM10011315_33140 [Roseovarius pacificus]SHM14307.1 capsular polysaccharide transport system permease protein [Roseovarius pacificus]